MFKEKNDAARCIESERKKKLAIARVVENRVGVISMAFDWIKFLDQRRIDYEKDGRHVRLPCPFCAPNERHMSIDVMKNRGWWCWVGKKDHSGKSPNRLVMGILKCSFAEAASITGVGGSGPPPPDDFAARINALRDNTPVEKALPQWLPEFKPIDSSTLREPFIRYLERRGFPREKIKSMTAKYDLHCCQRGYWRYRIIFPVYFKKKLVAWSARTIAKSETVRYLAEGHPPNYLLWFDDLKKGGDCLVMTEGPFDALKIRTLGQPATCFFTAGPTTQQIDLLHELLPAYRRRVLLLDRGTFGPTLKALSELSSLAIEPIILTTRKDPGEISSREELQHIIGSVARYT